MSDIAEDSVAGSSTPDGTEESTPSASEASATAAEVNDIEIASNLLGLANGQFIVLELAPEGKDGQDSAGEHFSIAAMSSAKENDPDYVPGKGIIAYEKGKRKDLEGGTIQYLGIQHPGEPVQRIIEVQLMEIPEDGSESPAFQEIEDAARSFQETSATPSVAMQPIDTSDLVKDPKSGVFPCKTCGKSFAFKSALGTHLLTHTEIRPYVCLQADCKKTFRTKEACRRHYSIHTGEKPFECEHCEKRFVSSHSLKEHITIHMNTKLYKCNECGKEFRQISSLSRHQTVHTVVKRFTCEVCSKSFKQATYLRSHMKSHTGERPYRCDICNKLYAHRSDLNRHKIIHTGQRPYQCDLCGHSFADSSSRRRHMRDHSEMRGTYTCHLCNQYFRRFGLLKTHLGRRHNIVEVAEGDANTLKIVGSDSIDLHEPDDNTPRAKYIQGQLIRVLCQLRKAKPNTQYQFVRPPRITVSELLNVTRQFRDNATGVTVEEQDLAVQLAMNALQAEQNENVLVCEQELPLNQDGSISEHVYLTEIPAAISKTNCFQIVNDKGTVEYIEIEAIGDDEAAKSDDAMEISVETSETENRVVSSGENNAESAENSVSSNENEETEQVNVVEIDENIFQMHYDQRPELNSADFGRWLETFVELCKCWAMPLDVDLYEKVTHVHKTLLDELATPKGRLAEKENFEFMSRLSGILGGLITQHLAAVLTNLK